MHWRAVFLALGLAVAPGVSCNLPTTPTADRALWLWNSDIITSSTSVSTFLSVVKDRAISRVHAQINSDISTTLWESFIKKCNNQGIAVEALIGDKQWVLDRTTNGGPTLQSELDWIKQFQVNAPVEARFAGIHLDIEPWTLGETEWAANSATYVESLTGLVDTVVSVTEPLNLTVAADLPFWANTVACGDGTLDTCLLGNLDSVTFMTYRNTAAELLRVTTPLLNAAAETASGKPIWLAVEMCAEAADTPNTISYNGTSVERVECDLAMVEKNATAYSGFAGFAFHSYACLALLRATE